MSSVVANRSRLPDDSLRSYQSHKLCSCCDRLFTGLEDDDPHHHVTFAAFQKAIRDGCYICNLVRESALGTTMEDWVVNGTAVPKNGDSFTRSLIDRTGYRGKPGWKIKIVLTNSWFMTCFRMYRFQGK
ncbi:hypothetical protein Vi05172_g13114 [Venturia inaequalis]|nr:hypothetical protein Vi05172_g13114 [Venturia inaequalis]